LILAGCDHHGEHARQNARTGAQEAHSSFRQPQWIDPSIPATGGS
jgi:hypothetical protein